MSKLSRQFAELVFSALSSIRAEDIPYDGTDSIKAKIDAVGSFPVPDGSVSAPSMNFANETNTGFYRVAAGSISVAHQGVQSYQFNAANIVSLTSNSFSISNSATIPYAFSGAGGGANNGMGLPASNTLGLYAAGSAKMRIDQNNIYFPTSRSYSLKVAAGSAATPTYAFYGLTNAGMYSKTTGFGGLGFATGAAERCSMDTLGNVVVGTAALATTATNGFLYIPTCAGVPTGVPTAKTGRAPIIYDTTNNDFYIYNGGWKKIALA